MSLESPASIFYDSNGIELAVTAGVSMPVSTSAIIAAGIDSTNTVRYWRAASTGELFVTGNLALSNADVTASQGNAGTQAQGWFIRITDGTQVLGTGSSAPIWVSGTVVISNSVLAVSATSLPNVNQGNAGTQAQGWFIRITDGTSVLGTGSASPLWVTGSVGVTNVVTTSLMGNSASTRTDVARSATSVVILSSSAVRQGAMIFNDSNANLFLRFGSANATTSDFSIKMGAGSYFEVPFQYLGQITGIWQSAGAGAARITNISR
jgi:hypothetical protein